MRGSGTPVRLRTKLLLAATSAILTVAVAELAARLAHRAYPFFLIPRAENCMRRSALLSMDFAPNCRGLLEGPGSELRTNSLGLRGPDVADDGTTRILAVGDSCTFGWGVTEAQSYPAQLQSVLDGAAGAHRYQVINAGVPGYTSYQGLVYLRERGLKLHPQIVIVGFGFNDTFRDGDVEVQLARAPLTTPFFVIDDTLIQWSSLYRWLRWHANELAPKDLPLRVPPDKYERNLAATIDAAQAAGAHALLLSFWNPLGSHVEYRDAVEAVSKRTGVPVVTYGGMRMDLIHPTVEGYRELAHDLADQLIESGYVPRPPTPSPPQDTTQTQ